MKLRALWFATLAFFICSSTGVAIHFANTGSANLQGSFRASWELRENAPPPTVTMLFTGDIMLGRYIKTLRSLNGGDFPFTYMPDIIEQTKSQLQTHKLDLVVGNLEGPISTSNYVNPGTAMIFNFDPEVATLLKDVGFTTLDLANNHAYDQGESGYTETLQFLEDADLDAFGHPNTPDSPYSYIEYEFEAASVGFLGLHDATVSLDMDLALEKIQEYDAEVDFLIIGVHWGPEYFTTAPQYIVDMAHQMVDAGADFIWGHHPHVVQNSEIYNDAPIYYSLGNFVFDQYWSRATQEGLVVGLKIGSKGQVTVTEIPVELVNLGEPKPL